MSNIGFFGKEAREKLKVGIDRVYKTVSITLGSSGRNMVWNKYSRIPIISNDGVSGAREVEPLDVGERQGANLIKQVSEQTNDEVGDGTTTSIILAYSIIDQGIKVIDAEGSKINPMKLRKEITEATNKVLSALKESAQEVTTLEALENVATISVEDPDMGKTIAQAIFDAGEFGVVYVSDSDKEGVSIEKGEGYEFMQGMISPYLITNRERIETVLENPAVIITEMPLMLNDSFISLIQSITQTNKNILLICDEFHPDIVKFAVGNMFPRDKNTGNILPPNFKMAIVKKPLQANACEDIAALVGASVMTSDKGKIKFSADTVGFCDKVVVSQKSTKIFGGQGYKNFVLSDTKKSMVDSYLDDLKSQLELATDEITKTKVKERIARMTGGIFILNVGANTEAEMKYLRMKVDDAVNATRVAKTDGIVAGGGSALWRISSMLDDDKTTGASIVNYACQAPLRQIIENSGEDFEEIVKSIGSLKSAKNPGYDALNMKVVPDMISFGIIDPVKVTMSALANASKFASLFITVESLITPIEDVKDVLPQ